MLRRTLNVAVRKRLLPSNPCWKVEFPVAIRGLFRPHYMSWSEQLRIEAVAPVYLRHAIRIITETGLRVYKELTPMKKEHVDLLYGVAWIPDSKTANGVGEVPLTALAVNAFKDQMETAGPRTVLVLERQESDGIPGDVQDGLGGNAAESEGPVLSDLRPALHVRHAAQCRRRRRRVGNAAAPPGRRQGLQEVLADEAPDETRGASEAESRGQRGGGLGTGRVVLRQFCDSREEESHKRDWDAVGQAVKSESSRVGA